MARDERDAELDAIRRTYERYRTAHRYRLWDPANRGYARISRDRDRALVQLIGRSLGPGAPLLDVGCGTGEFAETVRRARGDLAWTGIDLLPDAIAEARRLRPWATWIEASADRLPFDGSSFAVAVAATLFSSLPSRDLEQSVANETSRVLTRGGWLIWYDLRYDNPANAAVHGIDEGRLRSLFPGWLIEVRPITLLPPLARRLGPLTAVAYPVLEALPPLRSHLIGRLQKPD